MDIQIYQDTWISRYTIGYMNIQTHHRIQGYLDISLDTRISRFTTVEKGFMLYFTSSSRVPTIYLTQCGLDKKVRETFPLY